MNNLIFKRIDEKIERKSQEEEEYKPDYIAFLNYFILEIKSHLSELVVSATLAHFIMNKKSRFHFSHDFASCYIRNQWNILNLDSQ